MRDVAIKLENRPGALAQLGEALGNAGISIEGGESFSSTVRQLATFSSTITRMSPQCLDITVSESSQKGRF